MAFPTRPDVIERQNLSQDNLARKVGLSGSGTVAQWERGLNFPKLAMMLRIAEALNQPLSFFFDGYNQHPALSNDEVLPLVRQLLGEGLSGQVQNATISIPVDQKVLERLAGVIANHLDKRAEQREDRFFRRLEATLKETQRKPKDSPTRKKRPRS